MAVGGAGEDELDGLELLLREGRLVGGEVAEEPGIVLPGRALPAGPLVGLLREGVRIHVGQAQVAHVGDPAFERDDVGLPLRLPQRRAAPVGDRVEAPGVHAAHGVVDPGRGPALAEAAQEVPGEEGDAAVAAPLARGEDGRRGALAEEAVPPGGGRRHLRLDHVGPQGQEEVAVGVDEPPPAVPLLHAEEAVRVRLRGGEATVATEAEVAGREGALLVPPRLLQVVGGAGLPGPRAVRVLAELVEHGKAVQDRVAGRGLLEADGAHLQRGRADRVLHLEADRLHVRERHEGAPQGEEVAGPRAVADRGHVVPGGRGLRQHRHGDRGAQPHAGVGVEDDAARTFLPGSAAARVDLQVDPLGRRRPHLQDERLVARRSRAGSRPDVDDGDPRLASRLRGIERDRRRQRRQEDG